jgi:hypothetical protein
MSVYTTSLSSLPNWYVKVITHWSAGKYSANVALVTSNGMVALTKAHASEHIAIHRVIDAAEELVNRIQYPHAGRLN